MSEQAPLASAQAGLAAYLRQQWQRDVSIGWSAESSAGARRRNLLFDADDGERVHALVATIIPNPAVQILSIPTEAAVLRAAYAAGVPVPKVHFDCEDTAWLGGPFFIGTRIAGESVPRRVLRLVAQHATGTHIAAQLGAAFAALHRLEPADVQMLARPEHAPAQQALLGLDLQLQRLLQPSPVFTLALRWLQARQPAPPPTLRVVHGDVRNGNLIVDEQGLAAILDWELTKLGDPMEDLAWPCLRCWRFGMDAHEVGGFGDREVMLAAYRAGGGAVDPAGFHWWKVMGTMRWGLGLAGQARAHLDGTVPSIVMAASGRRVAELEYDLLCLLRQSVGR